MSESNGLEEDAWRWEQYQRMKTDSETVYTEQHPEIAMQLAAEGEIGNTSQLGLVSGSAEPLFSAETVREEIMKVVQEEMDDKDSSAELIGRLVEKFQEESGESSFSSSEQIQESVTDGNTGPVEGAEELPKTFAGKTSKLYNLLEEKQTQFEKGSEPWIALDLFVSDLWTKVFEKNRDR